MNTSSENANAATPVFAVRMERSLVAEVDAFVTANKLVKKDFVETAVREYLAVMRQLYNNLGETNANYIRSSPSDTYVEEN